MFLLSVSAQILREVLNVNDMFIIEAHADSAKNQMRIFLYLC